MNALLDTLHLDSVNVLGWSDRGNTGLIMAMKYPGKVKMLATMGANVYSCGDGERNSRSKAVFLPLFPQTAAWRCRSSG